MSAHRLRHGAGVPEPLSIDCPDDEQVNGVGAQVPHCELAGLYVVGYRLPAVAHRLTAETQRERARQRVREPEGTKEGENQLVSYVCFSSETPVESICRFPPKSLLLILCSYAQLDLPQI